MKLNINEIPQNIKDGKITTQEAVNQLSVFIIQNPAVFGLQNEDEDITGEIVIKLLEKQDLIFKNFNPRYGTFFTYFFCFVKSLVLGCSRKKIANYTKDSHVLNESILNYETKTYAYANIDYEKLNQTKAPYSAKKADVKAFEVASSSPEYSITKYCPTKKSILTVDNSCVKTKLERIILILALKSSYYITDEQIRKTSIICKIDEYTLRLAIEKLNKELEEKAERHSFVVNRRNRAYYLKKKYELQINKFDNYESDISEYSKFILDKKCKNQTNHWQMLNELLENGIINIRPTNKAVAEVIGLCERQISYYLKQAKELKLKL